jgi:phosphatidylinositol alpha-mannosyltransferase
MKIGIVTEYYYPLLGGITEHVHHFALELKKLGHEPVIITSNAGTDPFAEKIDIEIIRIGKSLPIYSNGSIARMAFTTSLGRKIKEMLRREKFDIIHIQSPFVPSLPLATQHFANTTTVGTFHTHFDSSFFLRAFKSKFQRYFDSLHGKIAVSDLCIDSMRRYFTGGDFRIIPNGVDTEKFRGDCEKISKFDDGKLNIFFLSRLEPRNGLDYLIKAFDRVRKDRNDCRLIIGGDGPLKTYYRSIVSPSSKDDIHFLGRIDGTRPNYYATSDIFCFPTTKASFGITILEAMSAGKPVVAFSMPAYEKILQSGKEGLLCGEPTVDNLANALNNLLDSRETREEIGKNARVKAEEYSWSKITKRIVDYYEEIKRTN